MAALSDSSGTAAFGPLISAAGLAGLLDDPDTRIVDCRWSLDDPGLGRSRYDGAHIPGSIYASLDDDLADLSGAGRHPLPDPARFVDWLATNGIGLHHTVVAYDDEGGAIAARLWWMLRAIGYQRAAVLEGGFPAWLRAGHATTTSVPQWPAADPTWTKTWKVIDRNELLRRLGKVQLIDARAPERFRGEYEPIDDVAGHIPSAVNLPYAGNLDSTGHFLPADLLREHVLAAGIDPDGDVVVYCGSGVTACHTILALELAGVENVTLYPGSWSDWSRARYPVALGD